MKKLFLSFFAITAICLSASAQTQEVDIKSGHTSFYAELGGPGILFSANVDKRFKKNSDLGWGGRIGLGFVSGYMAREDYDPNNPYYYDGEMRSVVTVPVQINYIFGKGLSPHTFEVGGGVTIAGKKLDVMDFYDENRSSVFGTASFMYRRQPIDGGFSWRVGFTPIIAKGYIQPFGGVSVGYNF
jgi:hypothetical protein